MKTASDLLPLFLKAKDGALSYEEFERCWPLDSVASEWSRLLRDDLEDAVVHFPVSLLRREPRWDHWYRSPEYMMLSVDIELLQRSDKPVQTRLDIRRQLGRMRARSAELLSEQASRLLDD